MPEGHLTAVRKSPIVMVMFFMAIAAFGAQTSYAEVPESFPDYASVDSSYLADAPALSTLARDSEGIYIWYDSQGAWNLAFPANSSDATFTQYHGSALVELKTPPVPGENIFIRNLGDVGGTSNCYALNNRWGWYQRGENLYEIWWDFTSGEEQNSSLGLDRFIVITVYGGSTGFNIWSSGGQAEFAADRIYLGASMRRLSEIPGFAADFAGISDPYQAQAGQDPAHDPNTTVFTRVSGSGESYNADGEIVAGQDYLCGPINGVLYGDRFAGAFSYEGNGAKFSSILTVIDEPRLEVNNITIQPLADDTTDVTIFACGGTQIWPLMAEFTPWENVNRFGFYTDIGTGNVKTLVFAGLNNAGFIDSTFLGSGTEVGLWLHNDTNGDSIINGDDSYLVSERALTYGSGANEHQWFKVYDVSAYKGTGASYDFYCPTEDYSFTGDFDYLVFIDDNHTSSNFDHNDMILGMTCPPNDPPVASCPGDTTIFLCELGEICLPGFSCFDNDGDLVSCSVSMGNLNGDEVCFTPPAEGTYEIALIATDSHGEADTCVTEVTVELNSSPVASAPDDTTMFVCDLSQICLSGFTYSDADGNISSVDVTGGTLNGSEVCFTPVEGANAITMIVTDECGEADTAVTVVTVDLNEAPTASSPNDTSMFVCDLSQICMSGFIYSDGDNNISSVNVTGGTLNGNEVCFTPVEGVNTITMIVTDDCGEADTAVTVVTVESNEAPVANSPNDTSMFVCDLGQICLSGFTYSDGDNNISSVNITGGTLNGNEVCFTPVEGANTITMIVTDDCGEADTAITIVTVDLNEAPVADSPNDSTMFVCDLSQICLPGFTYGDADNNISSVDVTGGTLNGNEVCFTPVEGANTITMIVTDECGEADTAVTVVTVDLNEAPVANSHSDTTIFACDMSQICIPGFTYSDADGNISSVDVTGGTLNGDEVCFNPVMGQNIITLIVTDECGEADTAVTVVTVDVNTAPIASSPNDTSMFVCDLGQICLTGFTYSDANGNISSVDVTGGTLNGNEVCFTPVEGANTLTLIVTDECGEADTAITVVTIDLNEAPVASSPNDTSMFVCDLGQICLSGFNYSDGDGNILSVDVTGGTLNGDEICFTPIEGVNTITLIVTDECGEADTAVTVVTVDLNEAPVATGHSDTTMFTCDLSQICLSGFGYSDADGNIASVNITGGTLNSDEVCFTPVIGQNTITLIVTDECGEADTATTVVTVATNSDPYASGPNDTTLFLCDLSQFCLEGFGYGDPDNNIVSVDVTGGTLSGDSICFTPVVGANTLTLIVTDECGAADTASTVVTVNVNSTPSVSCPGDTSVSFVCEVSEICVGPFSSNDVDGNIDSSYVITDGFSGTFDGTIFCFTPNLRTVYTIQYITVDLCGEADTCEVDVDVQMTNEPPTVQCPGDTSITVCDLSEICIPGFAFDDANNNIETVDVSGGTYDAGDVCFTPVAGNNTIVFTVTDSCGLFATCTTAVSIIINSPPEITCMNDTTLIVDDLSEICLTGIVITDPDDNIASVILNGDVLPDNDICFIPEVGINELTIVAIDECGEADTCEVNIAVGYCSYVPGDANADLDVNGLDITIMVAFFKGGSPLPDTCDCRPDVAIYPFFGAGDANGDCAFNGLDVTYLFDYLGYLGPAPQYCPSCPPAGLLITSEGDELIPANSELNEGRGIDQPDIGQK